MKTCKSFILISSVQKRQFFHSFAKYGEVPIWANYFRTGRFFVCFFVCLEFIVPLKNLHSYGDVTIAGEGLQILTYARHSWQLSSEGSLTCHSHCDTELPFIMVISEDLWHSHLLPSVWQCSCHYFIDVSLFWIYENIFKMNRWLT